MIEAFNAMGVDISSVGNHEFDEGSAELLLMQDGGAVDLDALAAYLSLPANDPIAPTPRDRITVVP